MKKRAKRGVNQRKISRRKNIEIELIRIEKQRKYLDAKVQCLHAELEVLNYLLDEKKISDVDSIDSKTTDDDVNDIDSKTPGDDVGITPLS